MKTWTNPTVEELEVKMTANGWIDIDDEQVIDNPYYDGPIFGDHPEPDGDDKKPEAYPS